ncbi:hypothetical protein JCM16303_002936 [Sporobolomyces ruberrimus]
MASTKRADMRSPSPEQDEEFDPVAFQASLDESVNAARQLVDSWIPQDFGGGSRASNASLSVQSLKDRARPPRMGLGAQPAAIHKQQAEDRKLKERLLGKGRNGSLGDEGSTVRVSEEQNGRDEGASESDSDDEDSRSRVISKGKGKATANGPTTVANGTKHASNNPFVTQKKASATPQEPDSTPRLFNDPSPSKPSPSKPLPTATPAANESTDASSSSNRTIAPVSFDPKDAETSASSGLSKNQRKKQRKQEREQEHKQKLVAESRKEEEMERNKSLKRSRPEEEDGEEEREAINEDVDMDAEGPKDTEGSSKAAARTITEVTGVAESKKKKKKRKGKGKGGESDTTPQLLNL